MIKPVNPVVNRSHPLSRGLVGAWAFQDGGGLVVRDVSGQGNDGAIWGAAWEQGPVGGRLNFDGTNDQVNFGTNPKLDLSGTISVAVKVKTGSNVSDRPWVAKANPISVSPYHNWKIGTGSTTKMSFYLTIGGTLYSIDSSSFPLVLANTEYFAVLTYDGEFMRGYVNGVLLGARSVPGSVSSLAWPLSFGHIAYSTHWWSRFDGKMDYAGVWNRALTSTEVADLYQDPWDLHRPARPVRELYRGKAAVAPPTLTSVVPAEGADVGGTEIVLTGTNFASITSVTIGGVAAADFTVVSPTSIEATTDEGAVGQSDIVVVGLGGTATLTGGFEYLASETEAVYSAATIAEQTLPLPTGDHTEGAVFPRAAPSNFDGVIDIPAAEYKAVEPLSPRPDGSIDGISGGTGTNSVVDHRNAPFKLNKKPDYRNL